MGPRYVFIADRAGRASESLAAAARRMEGIVCCRAAGAGFALFLEAGARYAAAGSDHCFAIGTIFSQTGESVETIEPVVRARRWNHELIRDHWGGFVVVHHDVRTGTISVLRDASSTYPAYYVNHGGLVLVSSDIGLLTAAMGRAPAIDWDGVNRHLLCDMLRPAQTGLAGVTELLAGEMLTIGQDRTAIDQLWSPWTFTSTAARIESLAEAVELVRSRILMSVAAWSAQFRHALLGVSGGLDSSVLAAALVRSGVAVTGLTLATTAPRGDERLFARMLTDALGIELHEAIEAIDSVDLRRSDASHLPRPIARGFAQWGNMVHLAVAVEVGADVFLTGAGGDNVFCSIQSVSVVADRILAHGLGRGAVGSSRDLSLLSGCTVVEALWRGARRALRRDRPYRWPVNTDFLAGGAQAHGAALFDHPWLISTPADVLPGKSMHVAWIMGVQNHLEGFGRERVHPLFAPLMAQPVIEACLRVPSWLWCSGGRNRAVVRAAFAEDLPVEILRRRIKGSPSSFMIGLFEANRSLIREFLASGLLARERLIDVAAVTTFLDSFERAPPARYARLMTLVDVEAWARSWEDRAVAHA